MGNLKETIDECMVPENATNLPEAAAYTINGQPGDFALCSASKHLYVVLKRAYIRFYKGGSPT